MGSLGKWPKCPTVPHSYLSLPRRGRFHFRVWLSGVEWDAFGRDRALSGGRYEWIPLVLPCPRHGGR